MAGWTLRNAGETREGLTIYQLQELVRAGRVRLDAEVSDGGPFVNVREVPKLAALFADDTPGERRTVRVGTIELAVDEHGRPLPPTPEQIAQLLATDSDAERGRARAQRVRQVALVAVGVLSVGALGGLLVSIFTAR